MTNKKVLVTGADGFIGSHLVELLVKNGYKVKAFCFYNSLGNYGWLNTIPKEIQNEIEICLGDIRDSNLVREYMRGCDEVFHLAALIAIPYSYVAPASYVDTNIHGTLNVVQAARDLNIEQVIHTSTSETYGTAKFVPISEDHPLVGQSPYAASKIGADQIALSFWRSFKTPITIIRPFNTYGPRQSTRAVIPTIITQIASGEKTINLGSITPTRDFNFVEDTCSAYLAIERSSATIGKVINVASNFEISIGKTAKLIAEVMSKDVEIKTEIERIRPKNSEVNRLFGDNSLIKSITDWDPKYKGLEGFKKGLRVTIEWFCDPYNLSRYNPNKYAI
tara:strand:- start:101 stop:1105 length:1005 start_codon:yes stop_codon:yes gene_type:complete